MTRILIPLALTLLLAVSSVGFGVAQGRVPPAGSVTLCTGHGVVTIYVDADGVPVERTVLCPECALAVPLPGPVRAGQVGDVLSLADTWQAHPRPVPRATPWYHAAPRGPPAST